MQDLVAYCLPSKSLLRLHRLHLTGKCTLAGYLPYFFLDASQDSCSFAALSYEIQALILNRNFQLAVCCCASIHEENVRMHVGRNIFTQVECLMSLDSAPTPVKAIENSDDSG